MRKMCVIILVCLTLLIMGCQMTPSETPVCQKSDLVNLVSQAENDKAVLQNNKILNKQWNFKNVFFNINTKVDMPNINQIPVYRVKPKTFSKDLIIKMIEYFEPSRQWYEFNLQEPKYKQKPKGKLEEELIELKANTYFQEHNPDEYDFLIEQYKELIKEADDEFELSRYDIKTQIKENCDFCIGTNIQDDPIFVDTYYNDNTSAFLYSKGKRVQVESLIEFDGKERVTIEVEKNMAIDLGNKAIRDLGLADNMKLAYIEKAYLYGNELSGLIKSGGYYLIYLMSIDGLDTKYIGDGALIYPNNMPEYSAPPWEQQCIEIFVDQNGIQYFYWRGYSDITEEVASNVSIIDFEEMENRICKQLEYLYKPMSETYDGDTTKEVVNINVNEISLGAALLGLKDNNKEAYLVPVWYVPYTVKDSIFYDDQSGKIVQEDFIYDDALVFNAIDGSVVEPRVAL